MTPSFGEPREKSVGPLVILSELAVAARISAQRDVNVNSHPGQKAPAFTLTADDGSKVSLAKLAGSPVVASHKGPEDTRVQDAYSVRCAPQVAGAARDTLAHARLVASREAAAAVDRSCHAGYADGAAGTQTVTATAPETGLVRARLSGEGDWDLGVFEASSGRAVAGSAGFGSNELAEGFGVTTETVRRDLDLLTLDDDTPQVLGVRLLPRRLMLLVEWLTFRTASVTSTDAGRARSVSRLATRSTTPELASARLMTASTLGGKSGFTSRSLSGCPRSRAIMVS